MRKLLHSPHQLRVVMVREGFYQRVHAIFCKSVIVCGGIFASGYLVSIVPEFQRNQYHSDIYFAVNLNEFTLKAGATLDRRQQE